MLDPMNRPRLSTALAAAFLITFGLLAGCQPEVEEAAEEEDLREEEALEQAREDAEDLRTALGNFNMQLGDGTPRNVVGNASCVVQPAEGGTAGQQPAPRETEPGGTTGGDTGTAGPSGTLRVALNPDPVAQYRYFLEIRDYSGTGQYTGIFGMTGAERSSGGVEVGVRRVAEGEAGTGGGAEQGAGAGAQPEAGELEDQAGQPAEAGAGAAADAPPQLKLTFAGSYSGAAGSGSVEGDVRCPLPEPVGDGVGLEPAEEEIE